METKEKREVLSVIIPCFNEEDTIEDVIKAVCRTNIYNIEREIVVVDDYSSDNTWDKIQKLKSKYGLVTIRQKKNGGKGAAVKAGLGVCVGTIVLIQDADMEYDPSEYSLLLEPILTGKADVVYGSRFLGARPHRVLYYWHSLMNRILTVLSNMFTNINLTDMETCYKVVRGDIIRQIAPLLKSKRFGFEPEITARLARIKGLRFYEVGISYYGRTYNEGKKITWRDGLKAIYQIFYYNVVAR